MQNNLPLTTIDWSQKFNRKKTRFMFISLILALFITFSTYTFLHKAKHQSELVDTLVVTKDISKYSQLTEADFRIRKMRRDQIPTNSLTSLKEIKGLVTVVNLKKEQLLSANLFEDITNPNSVSAEIKDGLMAISVGFDWLTAPVPDIKAGDTIDIIASESHKVTTEGHTTVAAQAKFPVRNAKVIRVVKEGDYKQNGHLVLEVTEEQANNIMNTRALKVFLNIVVK